MNQCTYKYPRNIKGHLKNTLCNKTDTFLEDLCNYKCRNHLGKKGNELYCQICNIVSNYTINNICEDCTFIKLMPASLFIFEFDKNIQIEKIPKSKIKILKNKYFHANWNTLTKIK